MPGTQEPGDPVRVRLAAGRARVAGIRVGAGAGLIASVGLIAAAGLAGCSGAQASSVPIKVASAYVLQSTSAGVTDGYLVIQNAGSVDRLLAVRSSAGGTIIPRGPIAPGTTAVQTVSALRIPGHSLVRLDPGDIHLVVTGSRPMRQGTNVTLTLVFARAGIIKVAAEVTNPQTGGNTYFGP